MTRILILNGHPKPHSLSALATQTYADAARQAGAEVRVHSVADLRFDPDFGDGGYEATKPLEPDLEAFLADLEWCEHFVLAAPMWWGNLPAMTRGLFDRVLLPGRTFDTRSKTAMGLPKPLLTGRTAQLIMTSDTPLWALRLLYSRSALNNIHGQILKFVGMKPLRPLYFSGATEAKEGKIKGWMRHVRRAAVKAA